MGRLPLRSLQPIGGVSLTYIAIFALITAVGAFNFDECTEKFKGATDKTPYLYTGRLYGGATIPPEKANDFISLPGCLNLCGSGVDFYPWKSISKTISTWVLPVIGLLLQLPFESNQFWNTTFAFMRWTGSPIASLSYILWNIKLSGKAALLSDMATDFDTIPKEHDPAAYMRDSLFMLSVMNQYTPNPSIDGKQATSLLRIALFANEIPTLKPMDLRQRRRKLGRFLRESRKRGVVPIFISLGWFVFALAISIQDAFGSVGDNATAHDLALGLLLAWFPVLIVSGIVDRNPVLTDSCRKKINKMLLDIQQALQQDGTLKKLCANMEIDPSALDWVFPNPLDTYPSRSTFDTNTLLVSDPEPQNHDLLTSDFFTESFAGQGRVRWHYGVAHPILVGIESSIIDKKHRNWLAIPKIESILVRGPKFDKGIYEFDAREIWEIINSLTIVAGTISGAFVISYRTPTVGLGCRAGGYMIFGTIALALLMVELLAWFVMSKMKIKTRISAAKWQSLFPRIVNGFLRFGELFNTAWLTYIVTAQTLGSYMNCKCLMSTWGRWGGYLDMTISEYAPGVQAWWLTGAVLSSSIMFIAISFLVAEWCEQSHLNTENFENAIQGLQVTRWWKQHTLWVRRIPNFVIQQVKRLFGQRERQSVVWTVK